MTVSFTAKAQWNKWHFGGGVGSMTYYGDLSDKFVNANLQELGYHAYVERIIASKAGIYLRLESVNGHLIGSDRAPKGWINGTSENFDRSLNFRTSIHDVNTSMVFYFGSINKKERIPFLNAYVRAGIGVGYFDVYGDLKDAEGNNYNYWSDGTIRSLNESSANAQNAEIVSRDKDYETNLRELGIEKSYNRFKWQIPVGLGLKMRLGDAVSLVLDAQYTYNMTDYLDNVGDNKTSSTITDPDILYAADPAGFIGDQPRNIKSSTGINDSYLYVSAGLTFNVGDNSKPKFKTPIFYPKTIMPIKDTLEEETVTNTLKDTILLKEEKKDTVLQNIVAPSSLSLKMRVDSVSLVKSPTDPTKYIVQYYLDLDSLQSDDAQLMYEKNIVVTDTTKLSLLADSIKNTSGQTILREVNDSLNNDFIDNKVMTSQDSVVYMIQQLKLQLDQLQQKVAPSDSTQSMDSLKAQVNPKKDTITSNAFKKVDNKTSFVAQDTLKSKVPVVNSKMDSINHHQNQDSITRVLIPIVDSSNKSLITTKKGLKDLESNQLVVNDSTLNETTDTSQVDIFKFSPANYTLEVKDTVKNKSLSPEVNASNKKSQNDSIASKTLIPAFEKDTIIIIDTSSTSKWRDSVQYYNQQRNDLNQQIEDLKNQLKVNKDTIRAKSVQIDSSDLKKSQTNDNQIIDDLKKQIQSLENTSKSQNDSLQKKEVEISKLKTNINDTIQNVKASQPNAKKAVNNIASKDDTLQYYERQQEELKRQIDDLQNQLSSKNEPAILKSAPKDTISRKEMKSSESQSIEELQLKIQQLENSSKSKSDSLTNYEIDKKNSLENKKESSKTTFKTVEQPIQDNSADSLKLRIAELENQMNSAKISISENNRVSSNSSYKNDTISTNSNKKSNPNITLSPNITFEKSRKNDSKLSDTDNLDSTESIDSTDNGDNTDSFDDISSSSKSKKEKKQKKEKEDVTFGFNYDKPGFFEARRLKKEGNETLATDDSTSLNVSVSNEISSKGDTVYNDESALLNSTNLDSTKVLSVSDSSQNTENSADSILQQQNEMLRNQISNIQKNQDSLIAVLAKLVDKSNQPIITPEPIEKEVKILQIDSSAIIESLLKQPSTKVFFAVGKSSVSNQYKMSLDQLSNQLNTYPVLKIRLKGFADPTGNVAANLKLSENRANAVKSYLIQTHNLTPDRIIVLPAGQEENSSDMSYSRRVEVQLVK
jgi:outer membrane protein OmpA-like peptidoglycan-associated protein